MVGCYRICVRCIMDTSDPEIRFDQDGVCNHCTSAIQRIERQMLGPIDRQNALRALIEKIKREGEGKSHDCIVGLSGGVDSTTVACECKKMGLRPLAVHFDNGWNSEIAEANIQNTVSALGIELHTYVVDSAEFMDLQLAFLKASVANCEAPTDHGITALLFRTAYREGIRFILSGSNLASEAIMPISWGYYEQDLRHLKAIHQRYGRLPLRTMPTISVPQYLHYVLGRGIRQLPFLNYVDYKSDDARKVLSREIGWRDYGGKHNESVWTRFFQGYYLPAKFGFDKRRAHLSSLICAGQKTREEALAEIDRPPYDPDTLGRDMKTVLDRLGLTAAEFDAILRTPLKGATEYPNNYFLFHRMGRFKEIFRYIATRP